MPRYSNPASDPLSGLFLPSFFLLRSIGKTSKRFDRSRRVKVNTFRIQRTKVLRSLAAWRASPPRLPLLSTLSWCRPATTGDRRSGRRRLWRDEGDEKEENDEYRTSPQLDDSYAFFGHRYVLKDVPHPPRPHHGPRGRQGPPQMAPTRFVGDGGSKLLATGQAT